MGVELNLTDSDYYKDAVAMVWADTLDIDCMYEAICLANSGKQFNELIYSMSKAKDFLQGIAQSGQNATGRMGKEKQKRGRRENYVKQGY